MTTERFQRLDALVSAALELPPGARAAYLQQHCAQDAPLRHEAESLLNLSDEEFLETPLLRDPCLHADGTHLGPYRLGPLLGRGGMGAVYQASRADGQFDKQVAIKLIEHVFSSPTALARFHQERKILARLDHPAIARLLDAGLTASGSPYVVMELVEGLPCNARPLPLPVALAFFRQVCAAVQYAHQNLIIHRDLKPSNILLTPANTPKLVDFGIAKVLDADHSTDDTHADQRLMTLNYASPEQILRQPVSTATDIYSLGLVLAELLSGQPVRRWSTLPLPELLRALETPVQPLATIPAELRAIITKATAADPTQRYPSALDLAADIKRYTIGQPVLAHPPSGLYIARKFAVRHRWPLAAATIASCLALFALDTIVVHSRRADAERAIADAQRQTAEAASKAAQAATKAAEAATKAAEASALSAQRSAVHANAQRQLAETRLGHARDFARAALFEFEPTAAAISGALPLRKQIASRTAVLLDRLSSSLQPSDSELQRELAQAYSQLGHVQGGVTHSNLGEPEQALASYQRAVQSRLVLLKTEPAYPDALALLAEAEITLGNQLISVKRPAEANTAYGSASAHLARARTTPVSLNARSRLAFARRDFVQFLQISESLLAKFPTEDRYLRNVALGHKYLAANSELLAQRLNHAQQALLTDEKRLAASPASIERQLDLSFDLSTLGSLSKHDDPTAAAAYFRRTVHLRRSIAASDPKSVLYRDRLAAALVYWAFAQLALGQAGLAKPAFAEVIALSSASDINLIAQLGTSLLTGTCPTVPPAIPPPAIPPKDRLRKFGDELAQWQAHQEKCAAP